MQDLLVDIRKANTLDEALSSYFSQEHLDNNDYKCEACKRRVPATKQFSLERPPKVLCVQLKRFSHMGGKNMKNIGFKQTVDMGPYLWREKGEPQKKLNYKLTSMVTHMGPSVNCGHYTAVAQVSSGKYYTFDDSSVRQISLNTVLNTNAYIMIFEMEPENQNHLNSHQNIKVNGSLTAKNFSPITINNAEKLAAKPSTSGIVTQNGFDNNGSKHKELNQSINCQSTSSSSSTSSSPQKTNGLHSTNGQKSSNFIGPLLPQKIQEKSQPRLVLHSKNGKVLNGSSLVPYDGSSDDDENNSISTSKSQNNSENTNNLKPNPFNSGNSQKVLTPKNESPIKSGTNSSKDSSSSFKSNGNGFTPFSKSVYSGILQTTKQNNGTVNGNGINKNHQNTSPKHHQNGKFDSNGKMENNGKDKWFSPTKAKNNDDGSLAASSNGWQVSKDTQAPSSTAIPNGWSVTDNNR